MSEADTHDARVLLAEDDALHQKVALRQLQSLGYSADIVANGTEVLNAMEMIPYDLILMDCQMPGMDGFEATEIIRRSEGRSRHTPIIAMTANSFEGDRERCIAAGMDDSISKPVREEELRAALERWTSLDSVRHFGTEVPDVSLDEALFGQLMKLDHGDGELLGSLVPLFFEDVERLLSCIESATQSRDSVKAAEAAHSLKGAAANLGAVRLAALAGAIERGARSSEGEIPYGKVTVLRSELARLRGEIGQRLRE